MQLIDALEKRRCVRKFKNKDVSEKEMLDIISCSLNAPCAGGLFSVRTIIVNDNEKKNKIAEACLGQTFIAKAPYLIVVCSDKKQTEKMYGKYANNYIKQQAGAAIQNMFLRITDLKLATCWVGSFDENAIRRILDIPSEMDVEAVLPVGYADEKVEERLKPELNSVLRLNSYKTKPYKIGKKLDT
ncbi:MAG: nitroreductase family protein [Nanoarchaeota archaeon]|nr:nitroreductase family protein [Nanoarchaeota archaeon]